MDIPDSEWQFKSDRSTTETVLGSVIRRSQTAMVLPMNRSGFASGCNRSRKVSM
jgi:hypothetical protein